MDASTRISGDLARRVSGFTWLRRWKRKPENKVGPPLRLDIQGLRMVAVVLVLLDHIFGWPQGGFIGVDVFFVISGFLITGILLRDADKLGHVSFVEFYRRRARRILPAATLTLAAIAVVSWLIFTPGRAVSTWWDSLAALAFFSNWRFAVQGTDYFTAAGPISPVRHFWSLSVEEQFYFVWPAVMAAIVFITARRAMRSNARHLIAGAIMAALVTSSFAWAVVDTGTNPTWSYFSTLTRAWELGFGALIAIFAVYMAAIPQWCRPLIAWIGLALIAFGAIWITEDIGFPGPWAIIPVIGSGLVIVAGTGGDARLLWPITNTVSVWVGGLSYSLYLWHWPAIVFLASYMEPGAWQYYVAAMGMTMALSILAYYYVEQPVLASSWLKPRNQQEWRPRRRPNETFAAWMGRSLPRRFTFEFDHSRTVAAMASLCFLTVGLLALTTVPRGAPSYIPIAAVDSGEEGPPLPPLLASLQGEIQTAVKTPRWPALNPSMDAVITGPKTYENVDACGTQDVGCWFGDKAAPHTIVIVGDSIAKSYLRPLARFVDSSGGQWRLLNEAYNGCPFMNVDITPGAGGTVANCQAHKEEAIFKINDLHPDVVIISNRFGDLQHASTGAELSQDELQAALQGIIQQFAGSVGRVALLAPPPADKTPADCYKADGEPADCVGRITPTHLTGLESYAQVAKGIGNGELIDTKALFCLPSGYCPMFVGTTPMKFDVRHITPEYGALMSPAFAELLYSTATFSTFR